MVVVYFTHRHKSAVARHTQLSISITSLVRGVAVCRRHWAGDRDVPGSNPTSGANLLKVPCDIRLAHVKEPTLEGHSP